jgi:probable phosphoglycerate mutase
VAIDLDPALREVALGAWEGLTAPEAEARFPREYARWLADPGVRRGGGETDAEAGSRAAHALGRVLRARALQGTIAVVSHGRVLEAALSVLRDTRQIPFVGRPPHLANGCFVAIPLR